MDRRKPKERWPERKKIVREERWNESGFKRSDVSHIAG